MKGTDRVVIAGGSGFLGVALAAQLRARGLGRLGLAMPAPGWAVRLAAPLVLRTDPELAIYGRYVVPSRLLGAGFAFRFPTLDAALDDLWP